MHGVLTAGVVGLLLYPLSLWFIALGVFAGIEGSYPTSLLSLALLVLNLGNLAAVLVAAAVSRFAASPRRACCTSRASSRFCRSTGR